MTWDIDLINKKMLNIIQKLNIETNENIRLFLIYEYQMLFYLLKLDGRKETKRLNDLLFKTVKKEEVDESNIFINRIIDESNRKEKEMIESKIIYLFNLQKELKIINFSNPHFLLTPRIKKNEYLEFIYPFLNDCCFPLNETFESLKNGYISFSNKKSDSLGKAISSLNGTDTYIYVYKPVNNPLTLVHELTHAYEFEDVIENKLPYMSSPFCETFANLTELLFSDYYLDTKYNKIAINSFYSFLIETYFLNSNLKKLLYKKQEKNYGYLSVYLSRLLAIHLYYLYLNSQSKFEISINELRNTLLKNPTETWNLVNFDELLESYYNIANHYNKCLTKKC